MKRIKKVIFVLVLVMLCSGCTIKYNIEIKENEVVENIVVNDTITSDRTKNDILDTYHTWMPVYDNIDNADLIHDSDDGDGKVEGIEYHKKNIVQTEDGYEHTYKYTYPIDEFTHANSLKLAFGNPNFYNASGYINLRTNNVNSLCNYDYFESLQVNVKVDLNTYKVVQNNAHKVNGNVYTWNLNRKNCNKSIISLTLNKISSSSVVNTTTNRNNGRNRRNSGILSGYVLYIFLGILVLVLILGYRWFNQMKERDNGVD